MDLKQLYQDIILDHGKSPRNFGKCIGYNSDAKGYNPLCGDLVQIYLKLDSKKRVEDVKEIMNAFLKMVKNTSEIQSNHLDEDQKIKIMSLSGVKQFPMRVKCATLSWHTLVSAMEGKKKEVNTEVMD